MPSTEHSSKGGINLDSIPRLSGSDAWFDWHTQISDWLCVNGLYGLVEEQKESPQQRPSEPEDKYETRRTAWLEKQRYAIGGIRHRLDFNARKIVEKCVTVSTLFEVLEKYYRPSGIGALESLCDKLCSMKLADYDSVNKYQEEFRRIQGELIRLHDSIVFSDIFLIQRFLAGLGSAYRVFRTSFNHSYKVLPKGTEQGITFDEVVRAVTDEEKFLESTEKVEVALVAKGNSGAGDNGTRTITVKYCTHCNKNFHTIDECWKLHPELKKHKAKEQGGKAGKKKKGDKGGDNNNNDDDDDAVQHAGLSFGYDDLTGHGAFMATQSKLQPTLSEVWIIDSGCTHHMTSQRDGFIKYTDDPNISPIGGIGGSHIRPVGSGTVKVPCNVKGEKKYLVLTDVWYCPDLGTNLISTTQLFDRGADVRLQQYSCQITKPGSPTFIATRRGGLLLLDTWGQAQPSQAHAVYGLPMSTAMADPKVAL